MNSLNKYYNFLSENNISTYDILKNYIEQDIFKLKIKEDKNNSNLAVIFNDKDSNIDNEFVRFFNGVIIEKSSLKIVCYTFDKCMEEDNLNENLINNDLTIQPVYEGTLIRAYYYDNKWNISTKKMINAYNAKWSSQKSFGDMFEEIFGNLLCVENSFPRKDCCYSFLMGHQENNILKIDRNFLIHLNTVDLINYVEVDYRFNCNIRNITHINDYSNSMINMNKEQLTAHIDNLTNNNDLIIGTEIGYMFVNKNGVKQKFMKKYYKEVRELWGNTNNRLFRYLHLRKNPDKLKKYLEIFIEDKQKFLSYETYLMNVATFILNVYRNRHISKQITKVPFYIKDIIYKVHGLYLQTKNKVSFQDINVLLHDLDEKKFCFIINNIEKDKEKLAKKKQEDFSEDNIIEDNNEINIENNVQENTEMNTV